MAEIVNPEAAAWVCACGLEYPAPTMNVVRLHRQVQSLEAQVEEPRMRVRQLEDQNLVLR